MEPKPYTVAKPFTTTSRRLKVGDQVSEGDDLAPFDVADLVARRFLVGTETKAAQKAAGRAAAREAE